jgi:hypothetical protein
VVFWKRTSFLTALALGSLVSLSACANTPWGSQVEQALQTDPQLQENPLFGNAQPNGSETLPTEIPIYPNAVQQAAPPELTASAEPDLGTLTYWITPDGPALVQQFYQEQLQTNGWTLLESSLGSDRPETEANGTDNSAIAPTPAPTPTSEGTPQAETPTPPANTAMVLVAQREELQARVSILPQGEAETETAFTIQYQPTGDSSAAAPADSSEEGFVVPGTTSDRPRQSSPPQLNLTGQQRFTDIDEAPEELRSCIQDLASLGVLTIRTDGNSANEAANRSEFGPNQTLTRRGYARWLYAANNRFYTNDASKRIRPGVSSAQPAFQDVPTSDPDFAAIQGLAEAGLIPSPLSGDTTAVNFRPDAPLTRETLVLWKVPLDTRQALPSATVEAVEQAWGFQDAAQIDPRALRAVLADHQNSDFANIRRAFGYTTLFQPDRPVTRAEAATVLCRFGNQSEGLSAQDVQQPNQEAGS